MKKLCGIDREKALPPLMAEKQKMIAEHIRNSATNNRLPCGSAMAIARTLSVSPQEVGLVADEMKIKISNCQLRCF
jgi:hypothetical protein